MELLFSIFSFSVNFAVFTAIICLVAILFVIGSHCLFGFLADFVRNNF